MYAEEIMVGDWIQTNSTKFKVVGFDTSSREVQSNNWAYDLDNCKPIPLTKEILEKNGFENIRDNEVFLLKKLSAKVNLGIYFDIDGINIYLQNNDTDTFPGYEFYELFAIKYVHELQHALKLFKIDKEIGL